MARRVFFHVGLPKTGTTYLQTLMWDNHETLRRHGVLLPGGSPRQHLWASGVVREDPHLDRRDPRAKHAWDRLVTEINRWPATAVVSHEFFASASAEQATRAAAALEGAEVHVVVTARWQEFVKNGSTVPVDDYPAEASGRHSDWDWDTLDLADVLRRWASAVPPTRVHVLTLPPPTQPREALWWRFATLLGLDPDSVDTSRSQPNESLGVVEVELLRRVNADLVGFESALDRGNWIRGYLAQGKLVPRHGERFWPSPERVLALQDRGNRIADEVAVAGYDVIGDVEDLRPPATVPERRHPDSVTDAELAAAASEVIAAMMTDVRRLTRATRASRGTGATAGLRRWAPSRLRGLGRRVRARLSRARAGARGRR